MRIQNIADILFFHSKFKSRTGTMNRNITLWYITGVVYTPFRVHRRLLTTIFENFCRILWQRVVGGGEFLNRKKIYKHTPVKVFKQKLNKTCTCIV